MVPLGPVGDAQRGEGDAEHSPETIGLSCGTMMVALDWPEGTRHRRVG